MTVGAISGDLPEDPRDETVLDSHDAQRQDKECNIQENGVRPFQSVVWPFFPTFVSP